MDSKKQIQAPSGEKKEYYNTTEEARKLCTENRGKGLSVSVLFKLTVKFSCLFLFHVNDLTAK